MKLINLILCIIFVGLSLVTDPYLLLIVPFYLVIAFIFFIKNNRSYLNIFLLVFLFIGIISLCYCNIYTDLYGNTRGPYYDDSLYYYNSIYLSNFSLSLHPPTLFEVFLAIPHILSKLLFGEYVRHLYLLPFNWILGGISITYILKIKSVLFPNLKLNDWLLVILILFNFNFIDTAAHLYRDMLLIFLIVLSWYKLLKNEYKSAVPLIILVFFIRGANGVLLIFFVSLLYFLYKKNYSVKKTTILFIIPILIVISLSQNISSSFLRGGFGEEESITLSERINNRLEYNGIEEEGGSIALRNGNLLMRSIYPIVYTFSPFVGNFNDTMINVRQADINSILGYTVGMFKFPIVYKLPLLLHIIYIGVIWFPVLSGFMIGAFSRNKKIVAMSIYMIIQILAISVISMQARHRLPIIFLYPIFYSVHYSIFYISNKSREKSTGLIAIISVLFIVLYNIYLNL